MLTSILLSFVNAEPHQMRESYVGKNQPISTGPPQYSCKSGFFLDGKKCFQEYSEPVIDSCPMGFTNVGIAKDIRCVQTAEKVGSCPPGSASMGKNDCFVTEVVPAISFCPPAFKETGRGCSQTIQLPIIQKCDVGKLLSNQCLLEDRSELIVETFCSAGFIQTARGCQKTVTYDCTRPRPSKKGVGTSVGAINGRPYANTHYGNRYGGGYYSNNRHLRMLGHKKHDEDIMFNYGKDTLPPPVVEVVSKQCERIEYAKPESRSFCQPGFSRNGKGCLKLIRSEPRDICSNGGSAKDCSSEKFAPLQHQCPRGYTMNGLKCSSSRSVEMMYSCPTGFNQSDMGCEQTAQALRNCPPGLLMRGQECIGKRYSEPIVTQTVRCVGKGCNEGRH